MNEIPADMWLHVAADALARYVVAGGVLELAEATAADGSAALMIVLPVALDDARLPAAFVALITEAQAAA